MSVPLRASYERVVNKVLVACACAVLCRQHAVPLCRTVGRWRRRCGTSRGATDQATAGRHTAPAATLEASAAAGATFKRDDALAAKLLQCVATDSDTRPVTAPQAQRVVSASSLRSTSSTADAPNANGTPPLAAPNWGALRRVVVPMAAIASTPHRFPALPAWRPRTAFGGTVRGSTAATTGRGLAAALQAWIRVLYHTHAPCASMCLPAAEQGRPRSVHEAAAQGDATTVRELLRHGSKKLFRLNALHPLAVRGSSASPFPPPMQPVRGALRVHRGCMHVDIYIRTQQRARTHLHPHLRREWQHFTWPRCQETRKPWSNWWHTGAT